MNLSLLCRFLGIRGKKSKKPQPTSETEMETADSDLDKFLGVKGKGKASKKHQTSDEDSGLDR